MKLFEAILVVLPRLWLWNLEEKVVKVEEKEG